MLLLGEAAAQLEDAIVELRRFAMWIVVPSLCTHSAAVILTARSVMISSADPEDLTKFERQFQYNLKCFSFILCHSI